LLHGENLVRKLNDARAKTLPTLRIEPITP
jgi:hypothetical protein